MSHLGIVSLSLFCSTGSLPTSSQFSFSRDPNPNNRLIVRVRVDKLGLSIDKLGL